eukprot:6213525-Pleurochrysis_carterae.AAC.1
MYRVAGAVSPGKELAFDTFWERGHDLPPFKVDNDSAFDFLLAVLDSPVGKMLASQQLDRVNACASGYAAMPAVYTALASLHCNERVPQPSKKTLKRLAVAVLGKGKPAHWCCSSNFLVSTHASEVSSGQQGESSRLIGGDNTLPSDEGSRNQPPN